ncbi:MAG: aconitate hydratase [Nanoarchaeota archaeon]|nr:aconitate hydratase [Nanoarchaeota archaeon]MBU1623240.1 aconitate hydratase [Nanoarchaeota archaeon]MBU1973848.1 aconitate hydratase [Nanoarchaeota archaeon]
MSKTLTEKIIKNHLVAGSLQQGTEVALRIDQTLTQDATGTMACLQFEALGLDKVKTKLSVSYVDHNTLQTSSENADDHQFLQTFAAKYGIQFSKPGNGICHQVHLERFALPGETLLGSDSHTPTAGGLGVLAIGAGGLDVAVAMAGGAFHLTMPKIFGVKLNGRLNPWISAKDVILELLGKLGVDGGVGKIFEYFGEGVKTLTVPERATITNMGAELGATSSIFPSDHITKKFMASQNRAEYWQELSAAEDAVYDQVIEIDLNNIEPMLAQPHSPGNVCKVTAVAGLKINQVCLGSCTNSSYQDLMIVAKTLQGKKVSPGVSLVISPGSKQVYESIVQNGALNDLIKAGARILECACGPCIGMGQAPNTNAISLRTFNRNFYGRSGTNSAQIYLVSPETAVASALYGVITDPRQLGESPPINTPETFIFSDSLLLLPAENPAEVEIIRGPNIKPLPLNKSLSNHLLGEVLLKVEDDITTDHIMPAGAKILPLRSNIPAISEYVFERVDPEFVLRAKAKNGGFIIGGENYGQGSSREHAALAPMYLGIKAIIAKSFARIHRANLINFGILPLEFLDKNDYTRIEQGDQIELVNVRELLEQKNSLLEVKNKTQGITFKVKHNLSDRLIMIILAGGLLNYIKRGEKNEL